MPNLKRLCVTVCYYFPRTASTPFTRAESPARIVVPSSGVLITPSCLNVVFCSAKKKKKPNPACILSAVELFHLFIYFARIESALGLLSETSGLPGVCWITERQEALLQDLECSSEGYFVVLHFKIESDVCNPPNVHACFSCISICLSCMLYTSTQSSY